jgi:hypothetical protein
VSDFRTTYGNDNFRLINCQASNVRVPEDAGASFPASIWGFLFFGGRGIFMTGCQASSLVTKNPNYRVEGILFLDFPEDTAFPATNHAGHYLKDCHVSNIQGAPLPVLQPFSYPGEVVGIAIESIGFKPNGQPFVNRLQDIVVDSCVIENIINLSESSSCAGIIGREWLRVNLTTLPLFENFVIRNSSIIRVKGGDANLSAAILFDGVKRPTLTNNVIQDCDTGILFGNQFGLSIRLGLDALLSGTAGSSVLTVSQPNHGLTSGQTIRLSGAAGFDGIVSSDINGIKIVTVVDANNYTVDVSPSTALVGNVAGGGGSIRIESAVPTASGFVQSNKVHNCKNYGYRDVSTPSSSTLWTENSAFVNGINAADNYAITFPGAVPVDVGTLAAIPVSINKYYNLSII